MSFLVDTNVLSEVTRRRPNPLVDSWLKKNRGKICISTVTIAELKRGIETLSDSQKKDDLNVWLQGIENHLSAKIISFNKSIAHVWGQMCASLDQEGLRLSPVDSLIAATAKRYGLTVVTRNVKDFKNAPVKVLNPFEPESDDSE